MPRGSEGELPVENKRKSALLDRKLKILDNKLKAYWRYKYG